MQDTLCYDLKKFLFTLGINILIQKKALIRLTKILKTKLYQTMVTLSLLVKLYFLKISTFYNKFMISFKSINFKIYFKKGVDDLLEYDYQ